jgi:hypothetical protein
LAGFEDTLLLQINGLGQKVFTAAVGLGDGCRGDPGRRLRWQAKLEPIDERMIHAGSFRDRVTMNGLSSFAVEPGRYHLYVSHACPISHRVTIVHAMKKLEGLVGLSVVHPI